MIVQLDRFCKQKSFSTIIDIQNNLLQIQQARPGWQLGVAVQFDQSKTCSHNTTPLTFNWRSTASTNRHATHEAYQVFSPIIMSTSGVLC